LPIKTFFPNGHAATAGTLVPYIIYLVACQIQLQVVAIKIFNWHYQCKKLRHKKKRI